MLVNVLANLVTAAILYLAAVVAGYVTANRIAVTLAVGLVLYLGAQIFLSSLIINKDINGRPGHWIVPWVFRVAYVVLFVFALILLVQVWPRH